MECLSIRGVSKIYRRGNGAADVTALTGVNVDIYAGCVTAVLGLNGAGKSTLIKVICGLIEPDSGYLELGGRRIVGSINKHCRVGAVFEGNRNIYWRLTARENLDYFAALQGVNHAITKGRVSGLLDAMGLEDQSRTLAGNLSRGMQQRLAVAVAVINRPEVLLLDEPTLGVDLENVLSIVTYLKELRDEGTAIILTSHQMDIVEMLSDRVAVLQSGRIKVVEDIKTFLARSSTNLYSLSVEGLDQSRADVLGGLGVVVGDRALTFPEERLYEVFDVLKPMTVGALTREASDITSTFLRTVRD